MELFTISHTWEAIRHKIMHFRAGAKIAKPISASQITNRRCNRISRDCLYVRSALVLYTLGVSQAKVDGRSLMIYATGRRTNFLDRWYQRFNLK
jgi:hypothetical protein